MRKLSAENSQATKLKELKIVKLQCLQKSRIDKECKENFRVEKVPFSEFEAVFSNSDNTD